MRGDGALLAIWRLLATALGPLAPALLAFRRGRGKEDPARLGERLGLTRIPRPEGPLAWLHGASVGESLALLPLVDRLTLTGFHVLVTTGTTSSAAIMDARLPAAALHQYLPLDVPQFAARFLDHWRPQIAMFAESELWPNLLVAAHARGIPLALVNGRLSERSFRRWRKAPQAIGALLSRFDLCLMQSQDDALRAMQLGAPRVQVAGNLKFDAPPLPVDPVRLAELTGAIGGRPVWVAASTHPGEEDLVADAHVVALERQPRLLTIIVPRHADRGPGLARALARRGLAVARRSAGDPVTPHTQIYLADTMGESGLFYRVASVVFLGKSLVGQGGQNPIEPARLGCAILHGPAVANFAEVYRELDDMKGAFEVADTDTLARAVGVLLSDAALLRRVARAASAAVEQRAGAADAIMTALEPWFASLRTEPR